jgi:hypothetical protein
MTYTPDQLHNAIESGLALGESELAQLVRLARRLGILAPAGPTPDASRRMRLQFEAVMAGERRSRFAGWWPFAAGAPSLQRPGMAQRFAAGALFLSALGGTASVATGVSPAEAARATVRVLASAAQNLAPHTVLQELDISGPAPAPDAQSTHGTQPSTNAPAASTDPGSSATPDPSSTPAPGVAGTPNDTASGTPSPSTPTVTPTPISGAVASPTLSFPPGPALPVNPPATQGPAAPSSTPTPTKPPVFNPGGTPTATPTLQPPAPTPTETPTPTPTNTPTRTPTATPTNDDHEEEEH